MSLFQLLTEAWDSPVGVDRSALLVAASDYLDCTPGDSIGEALARDMAFKAMDWAVFDTAETYYHLARAIMAFQQFCAV